MCSLPSSENTAAACAIELVDYASIISLLGIVRYVLLKSLVHNPACIWKAAKNDISICNDADDDAYGQNHGRNNVEVMQFCFCVMSVPIVSRIRAFFE